MMKFIRGVNIIKHHLLILVLAGFVSACASLTADKPVNHVVLLWLKADTSTELKQAIIDNSLALQQIPYVDKLRIGTALPSDRAIVDDSFDIAILMQFRNVQAMHKYLNDAQHKKLVSELIRPNIAKIIVYDF